jgi:hypothetical protein
MLKGQCHEMDIFLKVKNVNQYFLCISLMVFKVFQKLLTTHWLQGKCARIILTQTASCMIVQNHRRLPVRIFSAKIASLGSWKQVTGMNIKN